MNIDARRAGERTEITSHESRISTSFRFAWVRSKVVAMCVLVGLAIGCEAERELIDSSVQSESLADQSTFEEFAPSAMFGPGDGQLTNGRSDSPSTSTDPGVVDASLVGDLPDDLLPANRHLFDGGVTESVADTQANNTVPESEQRDDGEFNIPTNGPPSPLFGAEPFSQKMLRFEEFGPDTYDRKAADASLYAPFETLPAPNDAQSVPSGDALDRFLSQPLFPAPTEFSNDAIENPWRAEIESFIGRSLDTPPAEGRPPGPNWSHQRWNEFHPETAYTTVTTGARVNGGVRDERQSHGYLVGEFGPGGLYHDPAGDSGTEGSAAGIPVRFHPAMPEQLPDALWTFDGTFPPKLLNVRYGEPVLMRHYNALPIDIAANRGFGVHTTTTHEHNGHNPAESDGYTNAFFFPGQFYDYRWPIALAGHDSINTEASDPRAGSPDGLGGIQKIPGDWRQTMSTHWFHDHTLDFTAQNVYKGSAAMMNHYSALDRGNEGLDDGVNLRLPSGSALDWGNRDYDVNLMLADKAWDDEGQLWFNPFNVTGFMGDVMTVNMLYKPHLDVRARRYRFRILNGSVSRYFKMALTDSTGTPVPFHMVANDGNLMEHAVYFENGELPTLGVAERYDIVVDFSRFEPGERLYFVNLLQHENAQVTDEPISLEAIFAGEYAPQRVDDDADGVDDRWIGGDPVVGRFLEFRVQEHDGTDSSMEPADFVAGRATMIPLDRPTEEELERALHRTFEFESQPTDETPWVIETDGGKGFPMDPRRLSAAPQKNSGGVEVWRIVNSGAWSHPVHIHFEEGIVLRRDGREPPEWEKWARKDVYRIGPQSDSGSSVEIALRFREFAGTYMEHCHNTQHEDHAMLLRWDVENPGQVKLMPAPIPSWDGVSYVDSRALPTFRSGDGVGKTGPPLEPVTVWLRDATVEHLDVANSRIGDALDPSNDERAAITIPLLVGTNVADGVETPVYFFLHDISDEALAEELGIAWAGALADTPAAALGRATVENGHWIFHDDLPNPVPAAGSPPQDDANTYTPLRSVEINGQQVIVNAVFVSWGDEPWEHMRIDHSCIGFPDDPPNTNCPYNGAEWGGFDASGHALAIHTGAKPSVTLKLHKSWAEEGDYLPYYIVLDSYPAGPANAMGVPYVPKHAYLGTVAVPLIQFLPPAPLNESYPPTPAEWLALSGGGPLGGQIGIPSYFMPEAAYSPMWHIGFARWLEPASEVIKSLDRVMALRSSGQLEVNEFPPPAVGGDNYDFTSPSPPHVVNCPVPLTVDGAIHEAARLLTAESDGRDTASWRLPAEEELIR